MRSRLESSESWGQILDEANGSGCGATLDASSVLKQWIRELPEPLLPEDIQRIMIEYEKACVDYKLKRVML